MKKLLLLLLLATPLSGCLYVPFDARADYPHGGHRGHGDEHHGHDD